VSLSSSHGYTIFLSCFKVVLSEDFQFGLKWKVTYMKIECIRLIPDRGQSTRQGGAVVGRATCPKPGLGLALSCVVLVLFFSEFRDFHDQILFRCHGVSPPHLLPVYLHAQQGGDKNTYQEKIECREQ
jgi:hypothetical protein